VSLLEREGEVGCVVLTLLPVTIAKHLKEKAISLCPVH